MRVNDRLYNKLKGGIYHSTSIAGYRGIRGSGCIRVNTGDFPFSHGQSHNSCCFALGGISLLDLRNPIRRPLVGKDGWFNWTTFLNNHAPITILLDIDASYLTERLYDYDSLHDRFPQKTMVAEAEVCYPAPIPIEAVRRLILVCEKNRRFFHIISGHEISDTEFSRINASFETELKKIKWKGPFPLGSLVNMHPDDPDAPTEANP